MKKYELLITLPGILDDKESEAKIKEITDLLESCVQEIQVNTLGKSRLAYPVKQIRYGYFYNVYFQSEPDKIFELQEKLRLRNDLLRAIISNYNPKAVKTSNIASSPQIDAITADELLDQEEKEAKKTSQFMDIKTSTIDLKDIDKKLDEILDDKVISGV